MGFRDIDDEPTRERKPRTVTVLALLVIAALSLSYLGAFAVADALVAAGVLPAWPRSADPRPRWMMNGFLYLLCTFVGLALAFRFLNRRQLRQIDAMADEDPA